MVQKIHVLREPLPRVPAEEIKQSGKTRILVM